MKIQDFINNRHKYRVDSNYQRPSGVWSREDNQCLIDTILNDEPMPLFFFNFKTDENIYYIVDGQQRLNAISLFYDNKIKLNKKFSGEVRHGKTFNSDDPISDEDREAFLNYNLNFKILEDYNDEKVRLIFSRLQRGKPLSMGELLNAKPGDIVLRLREIADHPFMGKSIGVSKERYGNFPDVARILYYEKYGCRDSGTPAIMAFFDENKTISKTDRGYQNIVKVLNFLERCFPGNPGNYQYFSKHAWVFTIYTMIRELMLGYALNGQEEKIRKFIEDFHNKVYLEEFRNSNQNYQRFYDNVRGGWSEKIINLRKNIIIKEFLKKFDIEEKDERRQITEEEKIACFAKNNSCQLCSLLFKDYKEPEYHHIIMHSHGGKTETDNIMVLCRECHDKIHGNIKIEDPVEAEIEEEN